MSSTRMILKAATYARAAHDAVGQVRKYTGEPYWTHTERVAQMVAHQGYSSETVEAALLHDILEDTGITYPTLVREFGVEVAGLVSELTDVYSDPSLGNRQHRKALECSRLGKISQRAATVKYCDLIDNTKSIVQHDPKFAKVYLPEKRAILEVMTQGDPKLLRLCWDTLDKAEEELV